MTETKGKKKQLKELGAMSTDPSSSSFISIIDDANFRPRCGLRSGTLAKKLCSPSKNPEQYRLMGR